MPYNPELLDRFPVEPGVYLMKNQKGEVIYVGKAKHLKKRVKQYFSPGRFSDHAPLSAHGNRVD